MTILSNEGLLSLWERGAPCHALDRGLLLLAAARPGERPESLAEVAIGERDQAIFELRRANFGGRLPALVSCPACANQLEFAFDVDVFKSEAAPDFLTVGGRLVRPPNSLDLAAALSQPDAESARRCLANRCVVETGAAGPLLSAEAIQELEAALDDVDHGAQILLDLNCGACGHGWQDAFDIVGYLWTEIEARARKLLLDVHTLASSYGWSEREVLALNETRRNAYLAMVTA